ncbi:uncharacterized protein [Gossypium hirsutum]|uniref:Uncharacterized protein n=1 Tax=Gossypium hirsutum TaxID=3635 RepID=A0ABM2YNQ6_GOSHI|nr:uncharacterized protein LOC121206050 [Gossypium hirsutum]
MLSSPPLKSSQAFSFPVKSRSLSHRRWSRHHRRWPPHMVAGSSKVSISSLLLARYGGARHAGMVLAEAWGVVADMVVTKDGASVRGKWGVVAKVSCCLFLFFFFYVGLVEYWAGGIWAMGFGLLGLNFGFVVFYFIWTMGPANLGFYSSLFQSTASSCFDPLHDNFRYAL